MNMQKWVWYAVWPYHFQTACCIPAYGSGPAWEGGSTWCNMDLHGASSMSGPLIEEASPLQDRPFSAAASVYILREAWERQKPPDIFQHQSTGYLRTRGQETLYETCACVIHANL